MQTDWGKTGKDKEKMGFGLGNWLVVLLPMACILGVAFYSRRYVRDMADYLSAGRVARRYVICVGGMEEALGVMMLIQNMEKNYLTGFSINFWNMTPLVVSMFIGLTGFCVYRFRETRSMTLGQFLEMRYTRALRVFASILHVLADILTEIILPAVAARFFIYFFDLPLYYSVFGITVSTYASLMVLTLSIALFIIFAGGSVALLVADCVQGLMCYPMFLLITLYAIINFSWSNEIVPVMFDRVPGESFMNPFDVKNMRDFNLFMIFVICFTRVMNRAIWIGSGSATSAKDAHEQKMAGVLGTWRGGFSQLMMVVLGFMLIVVMNHQDFSGVAHKVRLKLSQKVASEVMPELESQYARNAAMIGEQKHVIGKDEPLSQKKNLDTVYFDVAESTMLANHTADANLKYQKFRTLYYQQIFPVAMRNLMPHWMLGAFMLLVVMIMVSTDASRIFLISTAMAQDLVLPFLKNPMQARHQMMLIKWLSVLTAAIFFVASLLMAQMDYLQLFVVIVGAVWTGGAGAVMVFGLYSRFGTTAGAFASLISGALISVSGMLTSRNWADVVYPWLDRRGWVPATARIFDLLSKPFQPYIDWQMDAKKFPINAYEILFIAVVASCVFYIVFSLATRRKPFDLDKMLHRGEYADDKTKVITSSWSLRNIFGKLIGISPEYTKSDKAIAYSVFFYTFIYRFFLTFIVVLIFNAVTRWENPTWSMYYLITMVVVPFVVGAISSVWFFVGGVIDLRHLFRDLEARKRDFSDDGRVEKED